MKPSEPLREPSEGTLTEEQLRKVMLLAHTMSGKLACTSLPLDESDRALETYFSGMVMSVRNMLFATKKRATWLRLIPERELSPVFWMPRLVTFDKPVVNDKP